MTTLLAQRVGDGHHALGIAVSAFAARAGGLFAPEDERTQFALGVVVRRWHAIDEGVGEECVAVDEQVGADAAGAGHFVVDGEGYEDTYDKQIRELLPLNPLYSEELKHYLANFSPSQPSLLADFSAALTTALAPAGVGSALSRLRDGLSWTPETGRGRALRGAA